MTTERLVMMISARGRSVLSTVGDVPVELRHETDAELFARIAVSLAEASQPDEGMGG